MSKVATHKVDGIDAGLRFDDVKSVFESNSTFAVAKRINAAMEFPATAFPKAEPGLKNPTTVQVMITLACQLIAAKRHAGLERKFAKFTLVPSWMN